MSASRGIAGYSAARNDRYVHLADGEARLRLVAKDAGAPYVADANARIEDWSQEGPTTRFALRGHVPLKFSLANVSRCRVEADGRPLSGAVSGAVTRYELKQNGIERLSITCAS
jgi:hypothetical protein